MTSDRGPASSQPAEASPAVVRWLVVIYFCSGACSLMDEVVWVRLLKLTLGNTIYASSIVVSTFMGGLALGALVMGRYADRIRRRLRLYAVLELAVTVSALALPWALDLAEAAYGRVFVRWEDAPAVLLAVQVVVSAALLLVPTMLMGSTLPLLGRYVTALAERTGRRVGRLYALNMLGATFGCFLAGFVLIRTFGVMGTLYTAAGLNLLVAAGGWALSRRHDAAGAVAPAVAPARRATARPAPAAPPGEPAAAGRLGAGVLALGFFASGMVSIGYELIWMRTAAFLLGGFTYVFAGVLTVYLLGNVVGAWAGSRLSARLRYPGVAFGVSLTVLGVLGLVYLPWFNVWFARGEAAVVGLLEGSVAAPSIRKASLPLVHSVALFLVPALVMGLGFPLALQAWSRFRRRVGLATGTVYGANTIGAVLGGLMTGFLLVPRLGVQWALAGLALVAVWLGWGLVTALAPRGRRVLRAAWLALAVACTAGAVLAPGDLFRRNVADEGRQVVAVREGPTTTVAVTRKPDGHLLMAIDNVAMAGDDLHRSAQKTLGHLPVLLHRDPETVLLVGYGTGETAWCVAQHGPARIDCVEVAREVVEAAHAHFGHINLGEDLQRHVRMHYMDARNYLNLTEKRYDVIINDSDVHATAASAPLYAREHFANALAHLEPGGRFITKLHLQGHPKSNFDSILATFTDVFPHATVWFPATRPFILLYLVGSREAQQFSPKALDAALAAEPVRRSLAYMHVRTSEGLLSWYVGNARDVAAYLDGAPVTTDDRPFLAYNLDPHRLVLHRDFRRIMAGLRRGSLSRHLDWTGVAPAEREAWTRNFRDHHAATTHLLTAHGSPAFLTRLEHAYLGLVRVPDHAALRGIRRRAVAAVRRALDEGRVPPERVLADMQRLRQAHPEMTSALLVAAWALQARGDRPGAVEVARAAAREAPRWAATHAAIGVFLLKAGDLGPADAAFRRALSVDPDHAEARRGLAEVARRR